MSDDIERRCRHRFAADESNHPLWRLRCTICGLRTR